VTDEVPSLRASQEGENALHRLEAVQDASPPAATASRHQPHLHPDDPQYTQPTESSSHHEVDLTTKAHVHEIMEHEESLRSAHHKEQQKMGTHFAHSYEKVRRGTSTHRVVRAPYDADMNDSDEDVAPTEAEADMSHLDMEAPSLAGIRPDGTGPRRTL
jgi:hypothetical protein